MPYPIGTVNTWLLPGDPVTLVDAGASWPEGMRALGQALARHGLRVEDLDLLVLTHHHDDHAGLAAELRRRSGCRVAAHAETAARLADVAARRAVEDAFYEDVLRRNGAPPAIVDTVAGATARAHAWQASVVVDDVLRDGGVIHAGGHDLRVLLRPGHSSSDTLLLGPTGWAIVGDHLLAGAHAIALLEPPSDGGLRDRALPRYRDALAGTARLRLGHGFSGHGDVITDASALARRRVEELEDRAARLLREVGRTAVTGWELLREHRVSRGSPGKAHPVSMHVVVLSELLGLLDMLVEGGVVEELDDGRLVRYRRRRVSPASHASSPVREGVHEDASPRRASASVGSCAAVKDSLTATTLRWERCDGRDGE